jgi:hypothetical protein
VFWKCGHFCGNTKLLLGVKFEIVRLQSGSLFGAESGLF